MRILIFNWRDVAHPNAGGAEVFTHEVAKSWVRRGHRVTVFGQSGPRLAARDVIDGVDIVRRGNRYTVYREAQRHYRKHCAGEFDLVVDEVNTRPFHCHRWATDVPVVGLIHQLAREVWSYELPRPLAAFGRHVMEPWWLRRMRDVPVLTVSQSSRQSLVESGIRTVAVVPEGLDHARLVVDSPDRADVPTVMFCGRLAANKRPDHAIRAFTVALETLPDAQMWVVGAGPMEDALRRTAPPSVRFFGRVSDAEKMRLMASAHALVVTSVREGWGLVVSEAAAVGTPAIAYDVAGLRDSVAASGGVLVEPRPAALAAAMTENLPQWVRTPPVVEAGGVRPWADVADEILRSVAAMGVALPEVVDVRDALDLSDARTIVKAEQV